MKSKLAVVSPYARVSIAISASVFAKANSLYVMIYEQNDSLLVSTRPSVRFSFRRITWTESEHKNLRSSCHVTSLMVALQDKTLSDDLPSSSFWKPLHLALSQLVNYHERQRSQFVRVSGLQKLTQKIGLLFTTGNGRHSFTFRTKLH